MWQRFYIKNNRRYYIFSYKFGFTLFLSFLADQKQKSDFQQVGGLVMRNISVFCLLRVALYFKATPNSINFYKGIFLHVIPVPITVPWLTDYNMRNTFLANTQNVVETLF